MSSKIYFDIDTNYTRAAITEDGRLTEFFLEKHRDDNIVGNIYKGKITNVLQGLQAAFCNVGLGRNAYLSAADMTDADGVPLPFRFRVGDSAIVQVIKDEHGAKGARVTPNISIPGRLLALTPNSDYIAVSRRIEDARTRKRLTDTLAQIKPAGMGLIARTASAAADKRELEKEILYLCAVWDTMVARFPTMNVGLIHAESDVVLRTLRDCVSASTDKIVINDHKALQTVRGYLQAFLPEKSGIAELYDGERDMFRFFGLEESIEFLTKRRVDLPSGGYLIFDRTEALTVIDVNSGRFVGDTRLEQTAFEVNMDACAMIARQLRLRNIAGIILVDFIDMDEEGHRERVIEELAYCVKSDRIRTNVAGMTGLGLVEITRRKMRNEAVTKLISDCPYCAEGAGVFSVDYMSARIKAALKDIFIEPNPASVLIFVSDKIFNALFDSRFLRAECEGIWAKKRIYMAPDERFHISTHRIQIMPQGAIIDLPDNARMLY